MLQNESLVYAVWRVRKQVKCSNEIHNVYTGRNISVAILDTGIFLHPDLFSRILLFKDFVNNKREPYDDSGHGTHVAGCLAGNGTLSKGKYRGIAPECNLIIGKVLDKNGNGRIEYILNALYWILENEQKYKIRILNISISFDGLASRDKIKIVRDLLYEVSMRNILIITAAGNSGPKAGSISPLGLSNEILCVGCHDMDYRLKKGKLCESYSARGPGIFSVKKPDLVAPGTNIQSISSKVELRNEVYINAYESRSGTSFSTPIVSGAAALLLQKEPGLKREELKQRICYGTTDLREPWNKQGWGMLNITKILQ